MARPKSVECEVCGAEVMVAARGKVPRFCAEHTAADLLTDTEREADKNAAEARAEIAKADLVIYDDWPRQVAPLVWVGPGGERWTDQGEAERGMAEIRKKAQ